MPRIAGEFELIERYLAPLAKASPGAFGLQNDAAVLDPVAGGRLVATVDCMVAGRHFLADDPPGTVARKLLRVNFSDLAAMGASPVSYLLAASWPLDIEESWIADFCAGLREDQELFGVTLVGGDTTATPGPMTLSLTGFGRIEGQRALDRGSIEPGDDLYVSGSLGDAHLGLRALQGDLDTLAAEARTRLIDRYRCPQPRIDLGVALLRDGLAQSALDVSDGLAQDLGHLLSTSQVGATIRLDSIPVSLAAREALALLGAPIETVLSGGDDYEIVFAAAPERRSDLAALSQRLSLPIARIGEVRAEPGLSVVDAAGQPVTMTVRGWTHF